MSVSAGRVVCPRCGANNFDTQAACWKCGAVLGASSATAASPATPLQPSAAAAPLTSGNMGRRGGDNGPVSGPPLNRPTPAAAAPAAMAIPRPVPSVDPAVAGWSAAFLGLLFPWAALPAGIIFLMLDDRRRFEVGRITIIWGIVGTIIHTIFTGWLIAAALAQLNPMNLIRMRQNMEQAQSQQQQAQPNLNDEVPPLQFPGFPRPGP